MVTSKLVFHTGPRLLRVRCAQHLRRWRKGGKRPRGGSSLCHRGREEALNTQSSITEFEYTVSPTASSPPIAASLLTALRTHHRSRRRRRHRTHRRRRRRGPWLHCSGSTRSGARSWTRRTRGSSSRPHAAAEAHLEEGVSIRSLTFNRGRVG